MTKEEFEEMGYINPKQVDGEWCALYHFVYTMGIVCGMDYSGYKYRYCYPVTADAIVDFENMTTLKEHPPGNWIKRKGDGGDIPNPNYEMSRIPNP